MAADDSKLMAEAATPGEILTGAMTLDTNATDGEVIPAQPSHRALIARTQPSALRFNTVRRRQLPKLAIRLAVCRQARCARCNTDATTERRYLPRVATYSDSLTPTKHSLNWAYARSTS